MSGFVCFPSHMLKFTSRQNYMPAQFALDSFPSSMDRTRVRQSTSTQVGCRFHSATSLRPIKHASASTSSGELHRLKVCHAARSTFPSSLHTTQLRCLPGPIGRRTRHLCIKLNLALRMWFPYSALTFSLLATVVLFPPCIEWDRQFSFALAIHLNSWLLVPVPELLTVAN
jgi:hypothetical protein